MKILHATDLHYNQSACAWLADNQSLADVVCLTGDFLDTRTNAVESLQAQAAFFVAWFRTFSVPLFVCSGNHDVVWDHGAWLNTQNLPGVHGDTSKTEVEGMVFGCVPYDGDLAAFADCDVLLHHVPPSGSKTARQHGEDFGSQTLRSALSARALHARYILCGHVHQPAKSAVRKGDCVIVNAGGIHTRHQPSHALIDVS